MLVFSVVMVWDNGWSFSGKYVGGFRVLFLLWEHGWNLAKFFELNEGKLLRLASTPSVLHDGPAENKLFVGKFLMTFAI